MSGFDHGKPPTRERLAPCIITAARRIHRKVWGTPYKPGRGPMHHAGGPHWRNALLSLADEWERDAAAARIAARGLPHE